jgi:hypothetical protein
MRPKSISLARPFFPESYLEGFVMVLMLKKTRAAMLDRITGSSKMGVFPVEVYPQAVRTSASRRFSGVEGLRA